MSEELSPERDISGIVTMLGKNPPLIKEIKTLIEKSAEKSEVDAPLPQEPAAPVSAIPRARAHRTELFSAIKPYVSKERARAIDTIMTFSQILDMMKER